MAKQSLQEQRLIEKIRTLPPEKVAEVEDFVEFLRQRGEDHLLIQSAAKLSEDAFRRVWENPEYDVYDQL